MVCAEWQMVFMFSVNGVGMVEAMVNGISMVFQWCLNGVRWMVNGVFVYGKWYPNGKSYGNW